MDFFSSSIYGGFNLTSPVSGSCLINGRESYTCRVVDKGILKMFLLNNFG